jgi:hypothetical protein
MSGQRGKITIMSMIAFLILAFGAFAAFKFVGTGLEKKQIKKEVFDTLGNTRGQDRTSSDLEALITSILEKKGVEIQEVHAEMERSVIHYSFTYKIVADYWLFKRSEIVTVVDQIENYG